MNLLSVVNEYRICYYLKNRDILYAENMLCGCYNSMDTVQTIIIDDI
jgi:hypothetical protein